MSRSNIALSMTATASSQGRLPTHGTVDVLDTGEVRWTLRGADGGGRALLTLVIEPTLIDTATITPSGGMLLTEGWVLNFGSRERAERLRQSVRNIAFNRV